MKATRPKNILDGGLEGIKSIGTGIGKGIEGFFKKPVYI
jgi:hypothetical protein